MQKLFLMGLAGLLFMTHALAQNITLTPNELNSLGITANHLAQLKEVPVKITKNPGGAPGLTMERLFFGNAGGNRFVWRVDFADAIPEEKINILFYVDTDADKTTGRQTNGGAHQGVDLMLFAESGNTARTSVYSPTGTSKDGTAAAVVQGKHLFVVVDADLRQQNGATVVPVYIVAQGGAPLKPHSNIAPFELQGAPVSGGKKMERREPQYHNENVVFTWGLHDIEAMQADKNNIVLPITQAKLNRWTLQQRDGYRTDSATFNGGKGSIQVIAPQDGRYYPAFLFYDNSPGAALGIYVNGKQRGVAVATANDNNQKLFALNQPVDFKKGDILELRNLNAVKGPYRTEDLLLLKTLFPQKADQFAFNYVAAIRPWQQDDAMRITFTTTWAAQAKVRYGPTEKLGSEAREVDVPLNNHRLFLRGLKEGQKYFYRLAANDRDGKEVLSEIRSFVFAKPKYPSATATTKSVALSLTKIPGSGDWPVSSGVPLPQGQVFETANLRLVNAANQLVAAQKKVLARWHDGSLKWVLLSFLAPAAQEKYQLQYGAQIRDTNNALLASRNSSGAITVDTGVLRWSATPENSGAFKIALAQNGRDLLNNAQLLITSADGKTFSSAVKPDEVTLESNGPQQATVVLRGALGDTASRSTFFRYILRWHLYRNSPVARVQITLENDNTASNFSEVKSAVLRFNLPSNSAQVKLADVGTFNSAANQNLSVAQYYDDAFTVQTPQGEKGGARFPGWLQWQSGAQNLTLAVRDFWQLYPKALSVRGDVLEVGLAPPVEAAQYAKFKGTVEEYRSVFYLMNGTYKLRLGTSFTTEVALTAAATDGAQFAEYSNNPPLLVATPEYYRDSKAFGDIGLGDEFPLVKKYNEKTASSFQNYLAQREKQHEFGLMNYGDWWGERAINWGNVEYDTPHAFILQFARTGDVNFLGAAFAAETHNRDIDTVHHSAVSPGEHFSIGGGHYPASAAAVGRVWEHSVGHTGGYFTKHPVTGAEGQAYSAQGMIESVFSSSHTWTEGHYERYFLTGDTRSLQTANNIADVYDFYGTIDYDFGNCRVPGWHLIFTIGAYDATDDPFYLNAARIIVDRVLERQTPDGGWSRLLSPGHCEHNPAHHGEAGFMVGVLMSGLKYYAESTGEQRVKDSIVKASHFMINDMWIPEAGAFRYTSCPGTSPAPGLNLLIAEGLAYGWRQSREPELRRITLEAMNVVVEQMDGKGKNISMELRSTARQLFDVVEMLKLPDPLTVTAQAVVPAIGQGDAVRFSAEAKTLKGTIEKYSWEFGDGATAEGREVSHNYPNGGNYRVRLTVVNSIGEKVAKTLRVSVPPVFLQNLKPTDIVMQAEDFTAQGEGEVQIVAGRVNAVGKAITYWDQQMNHWLEWKFEVPQSGDYEIALKYASGAAEAHRSVQIDGKTPNAALQKVSVPGTGGFSASEDNWRFWKLLDGQQKPLRVSLEKGTHTIRMTNLGGGMALDFILLQKAG